MVVSLKNYHEVDAIPRLLPDGSINPEFVTSVKKLFRQYWLIDRLFRAVIVGVITAGLLVVELFCTLDNGVMTNFGIMVIIGTLLIYAVLDHYWDSYRHQEIYLGRGSIYDDLRSHKQNFQDMNADGCALCAILRTYYPESFLFVVGWLALLFCLGMACHWYRVGETIDVLRLAIYTLALVGICGSVTVIVRCWLALLVYKKRDR